ncbi:MAG: NAD-dependent epimerase/dehydratase family protein [Promethearchaeota archaeon]|nr:MAG: NAD-dependent epimerase/dehydratase family protein [Candidatus Lokiarchaeota archaeon]
MPQKVLVTGGAGFIGSHLVDELIKVKGHQVTVLDMLEEQVHGPTGEPPEYLNENAKFIKGSVTDHDLLEKLITQHEVIYHLAAIVGVGQSMYLIKKYIENNVGGTANLLNILVNSDHDVNKLVIASSNTIYGEGKGYCNKCGIVYPKLRTTTQLEKKDWEINCPNCGSKIKPIPTDEETPLDPSSVYALSKQNQEQMSLLIGDTYGINTTVLRFFLVYGPRQALSNPYTGVCAIFSSMLFNGKPPIIFEDGQQSRDFVNVKDICQALILSMEKQSAEGEIFNVGSGNPITIKEVAETITQKINPSLKPIYNQQYRTGDIRHCLADISKIKKKLGYNPTIYFEKGIDDLLNWIKPQVSSMKDSSQKAFDELKEKGLLK